MAGKKPKSNKMARFFIITLIIIIIIAAGLITAKFRFHWNPVGEYLAAKIGTSSTASLIDTAELANLSVTEFVYNGIAEVYKENGDHDYNILYHSTVKVSVDASTIQYSLDKEEKKAVFVLPEFTIGAPVIDESSIRFIPERKNLNIGDVISQCRSDALSEVQKSERLLTSARDNYESFIKAFYMPLLEGYSIEFADHLPEAGETK